MRAWCVLDTVTRKRMNSPAPRSWRATIHVHCRGEHGGARANQSGRWARGRAVLAAQVIGKAGDAHKMAWQDSQQVRVGDHFAGRKKLVHGENNATLATEQRQGLVHKAIRTAGKA